MSAFTTTEHAESLVVTFPSDVVGGKDATDLSDIVRTAAGNGKKHIVFDLSAVRVMNSSGLGMLVSSLTTARSLQMKLVIAAVPEKVNSLLTMTHLTSVFDIQSTVAQALATE